MKGGALRGWREKSVSMWCASGVGGEGVGEVLGDGEGTRFGRIEGGDLVSAEGRF